MVRHHAHRRDSSLQTLSRANRWLIAGSVALTGLLTEVAAQAFPGKASASSTTRRAAAGKAHAHHKRHHSSYHSPAKSLTPPAKAPEASESAPAAPEPEPEPEVSAPAAPEESPAPVVSGGS
jgi:hypothetical protein